jgi:DNA-directed RNA polymerase subunit M/transcription elongation factor TFIIS
MASVYFKCDCDKSLAADASDAGGRVQCPDCGKSLIVPAPEISWTCACGEEMSVPKNLAGVPVQCAVCGAEHTFPVRLELKRNRPPQNQQSDSTSDVPRVPVGRANEVQCPKCGYMSPSILTLCPRCHNYLHKGAAIRQWYISAAKVLFVIGLGWLLAAHFARISGFVKDLFGLIPRIVP